MEGLAGVIFGMCRVQAPCIALPKGCYLMDAEAPAGGLRGDEVAILMLCTCLECKAWRAVAKRGLFREPHRLSRHAGLPQAVHQLMVGLPEGLASGYVPQGRVTQNGHDVA